MKKSTYLMGVVILGVSIILAALILSHTSPESANEEQNPQISISTPELMTIEQLAEYLQISEQELTNIILVDDSERAELSGFDTYRFIPYLNIADQKRFMKTEIDEWLKYQNDHNYR